MSLTNLNGDILELIINYLSGYEKLQLIKAFPNLINILKSYYINFKIDLSDINIIDSDLQYLKGVHTINLSGCDKITDEGLQYLKGVHIIDLSQ